LALGIVISGYCLGTSAKVYPLRRRCKISVIAILVPIIQGFAKSDFLLDNNTGRGSSFDSFIHSTDDYIKTEDNLSSEAQWTKVIYLSEGDQIAVADKDLESIKFTKIKKITQLPPEQVYDIEVEGTHNFVANGIIAHNTYINGNLDMSNNLILNIGNAGTDFTSTGGLTLAGDFQVNANATTTGSLNVDGDFLTDGTGSFALANLTIDSSGNLTTTGYASTTTYLNTQGDSHIGGAFSVDGVSTFNNIITQTGTGQVTFTGNVNATNGLDVITANLTVGGSNFIIDQSNGNMTTLGYASSTTGLFTQGNLYAGGNATTSGSHYIGNDLTVMSGNVGIGTTTPGTWLGGTLTVEGTGNILRASGGTEQLFTVGTTTDTDIFVVNSNGNVYVNGVADGARTFNVAGSPPILLLELTDGTTEADQLMGGFYIDSTDNQSTSEASVAIEGYASEDHSSGAKGGY